MNDMQNVASILSAYDNTVDGTVYLTNQVEGSVVMDY